MAVKRIADLPELPKRDADSHKGSYGRVLVIAGSPGMTGAAYLAGKSALRSGSGLVTVACPESLNPVLEVKLTCVMTAPVPETPEQTFSTRALKALLKHAAASDAVALGPGISRHSETKKLAHALVEKIEKPLVIDADGLNNLEGQTALLKKRKSPAVLTPHPGEMARLIGSDTVVVQKDRKGTAASFAAEHGVIVVLKGYHTVVTDG